MMVVTKIGLLLLTLYAAVALYTMGYFGGKAKGLEEGMDHTRMTLLKLASSKEDEDDGKDPDHD